MAAAMKIDVDKLTFREILDIEEKAGLDIAEVFRMRSTRGIAAMVWVVRRREEPDFTWDNALELNIGATDEVFAKAAANGLGVEDDDAAVDPTVPDAVEAGST
jgi:hypothetical protein